MPSESTLSNLEAAPLLDDSQKLLRPRPREPEDTNFFLSLLHSGIRVVLIVLAAYSAIVLILGLAIAFVTTGGAIVIFIGNALFRAVDPSHYTDNTSALIIGAAGGLFSSLVGALIMSALPIPAIKENKNQRRPWFITACIHFLCGMLAGPAGRGILVFYHVDVGRIDALHATCAGALGAIVTLPCVPISSYQVELLSFISTKCTKFIENLQNWHKEKL